jgi:TolB protein
VRGSAVCTIVALGVLAACSRGTPPSPAILTPTLPSAVDASPTAVESTDPAPAAPEGLLRLTHDPGSDESPAWSWDGGRIAFVSDRSGVYEIYAVSAEGGDPVQLTDDDGTFLKDDPSWSPDDRQIAFASHSDVTRIYAFDASQAESQPFNPLRVMDEGFSQPLTDPDLDAFSPAWSPDGLHIALLMNDADLVAQLFILELASRQLTQLTDGRAPAFRPAWSPDGGAIAFSLDLEGDQEIFVLQADGSGLSQLTDNADYDSRPSWSPDGQYIVFSSDRGGSYRLHLMRADGSYLLELDTGPGQAYTPAWSPDGRFIAFASDRDGDREIYRLDAPALNP